MLAAGLGFVGLTPSLPQAFRAPAGRMVASANALNFRTRTAAFLAPPFAAWCAQLGADLAQTCAPSLQSTEMDRNSDA